MAEVIDLTGESAFEYWKARLDVNFEWVYEIGSESLTAEIWIYALKVAPRLWESPPRWLPDNFHSEEFLQEHVAENPQLVMFMFFVDNRTAWAAYQKDPQVFRHLSPRHRANKALFLSAPPDFDGELLACAMPALRSDKEVVLAAVTNYGRALRHACGGMNNDKEVCLAAVRQDASSFQFCRYYMQDNLQVACAALAKEGSWHWTCHTFENMSLRLQDGVLASYAAHLDDMHESFCEFVLCQKRVMERWQRAGNRLRPYGNMYGLGELGVKRFLLKVESYLSPGRREFEEAITARPLLARIRAVALERDAREAREECTRLEERELARVRGKCARLFLE